MKKEHSFLEIHPDFKLNGTHYSADELKLVAYSFIKEGEFYEEQIGNFLLDWLNEDYDTIKIRTSGSTGQPKVHFVGKDKMIASALATGKFFKIKEKSTAFLCLPAQFIAGRMMLIRAMMLGWHLDLVNPNSAPLEQVFKRYDFCAMTPFQLDNSLNRLHLIKKLIVGGGTVSENLINLIQGLSTKVYEVYGMTETVSHVAARKLNPKRTNEDEFQLKPFKALPKISFGQDDRNCLIIRAPKIVDKPLITNDIVDLETYKKFYWKGRFDNVINTGGIKIFPEVVERKLQAIITQRFFLAGIPDDALGEKLILFVEAPHSDQFLSDLKEGVNQLSSLDKFERPKHIYLIDKFEETDNGKVHRKRTLKNLMK